jgi:hypothetical protein
MSGFEFIRDRVPKEELLAQLAEEAAELCHAALKLRRVYDGTNPTPVKRSEAFDNLQEEIADVLLLLVVLKLDTTECFCSYNKILNIKLARWVDRLRDAEEKADGA